MLESPDLESDIDQNNKNCYGSYPVVNHYSKASGWLDPGEKKAFLYATLAASPDRLLDIGVGGGRTIPLMLQLGSNYVGIDYVPALVRRAQRRYPKIDLREMDARNLLFHNDFFGLVSFSFNGIDSVGDTGRRKILQEVHRILQPNGYFVFSALNHYGLSDRDLRLLPRWADLMRPKNLLLLPIRFIIRFRNVRKSMRMTHEGNNRSRRIVTAHEYGLIGRYTSVGRQCDELEENGFSVERCFSSFGDELTQRDSHFEHIPYIHYVAKKVDH